MCLSIYRFAFRLSCLLLLVAAAIISTGVFSLPASAQTPAPAEQFTVKWEGINRFRFFKKRAHFEQLETQFDKNKGEILVTEQAMIEADIKNSPTPDKNGWARDIYLSTCFNRSTGYLDEKCQRASDPASSQLWNEGFYLNAISYPVAIKVDVPEGWKGATCRFSLNVIAKNDGDRRTKPHQESADCAKGIEVRIPSLPGSKSMQRTGTPVQVTVSMPDGRSQTLPPQTIVVKDVVIVGFGDSFASGEGNPDRPIPLKNSEFCYFRTPIGKNKGTHLIFNFFPSVPDPKDQYWLPSRNYFPDPNDPADANVNLDCGNYAQVNEFNTGSNDVLFRLNARADWLFPACHRTLYGYQMRTAMAYALQNKQTFVSYVPFGCTGATIKDGLFGPQATREIPGEQDLTDEGYLNDTVETQFGNFRNRFKNVMDTRSPDAVLLSIGVNDVGFSGLVSYILFNPEEREAKLLAAVTAKAGETITDKDTSVYISPEQAVARFNRILKPGFVRLREELKVITKGDLSKVIYVGYPNPLKDNTGEVCGSTRRGYDVHPAFTFDHQRAKQVSAFLDETFLPGLKDLATCSGSVSCTHGEKDRLGHFVDLSGSAFNKHGFCARSDHDPKFDRDCLKNGHTFRTQTDVSANAGNGLSTNDCSPTDFRTYAKRERWMRTPNDSYLAAMTYPRSPLGRLISPSNLHDPLWGILVTVYGGAAHPTSEGHAYVADQVMPHLLKVIPPSP